MMRTLLLATAIALASTPAIASDLGSFVLPVMNGTPNQKYDSNHNKPVLVEFYYNTCPACNNNAANIKAIALEFNNARTHVLEIGYDCELGEYASWIGRHSPKAIVIRGCDDPIFDRLNITAYPTTIIFDSNHKIVKRYVGTWSSATKADIQMRMRGLQ